jgi:hypothetical protein
MRCRFRVALAVALAGLGCPHPEHRTMPRAPKSHASPTAGNNWPLPPVAAERLFARAPMRLVAAEHTPQGVAGAFKGSAVFAGNSRPLSVKWKPVAIDDLDNWNNNPRKEIAVYRVQRWFLDPQDYVVPTTTMRCLPLDTYRRQDPNARATIPGTACVLGMVSLWMQHVTVPDALYEPDRFATDANYAYHLSNFNVLAYLVEHRDARSGNVLVADDGDRHVFAIDNGISFGGLIYNFLVTNWDTIRVPAIRRDTVERLRRLDPRELQSLHTVMELRADRHGILQPVTPGATMDPDQGVRVGGGRVQLGLTSAEIDAVALRITALVARVDRGELPVF